MAQVHSSRANSSVRRLITFVAVLVVSFPVSEAADADVDASLNNPSAAAEPGVPAPRRLMPPRPTQGVRGHLLRQRGSTAEVAGSNPAADAPRQQLSPAAAVPSAFPTWASIDLLISLRMAISQTCCFIVSFLASSSNLELPQIRRSMPSGIIPWAQMGRRYMSIHLCLHLS